MNTKEQKVEYNKKNLLENIRTIEDFEKAMKNEDFRKAYLEQFKEEEVVEKVKEYCISKNYDFIDIDGVRVTFDEGWCSIRCSNTGPNITARFEGKTEEFMNKIKNEFMALIDEYNKM